jgi:hypothetical protein
MRRALLSLFGGQSAEEWVTEDWPAVSKAMIARMKELSLTQRELIDHSRVSKAIVGEIQNNTVQRKRGERTLSALSEALKWHPHHLDAVLQGEPPPRVGDPVVTSDKKDVPGRLTVIEHDLRQLKDIASDIQAVVHRIAERIAPPTD